MSQRNSVICDGCGRLVLREGHAVPKGWMHLNGWFRPEDDGSGYSGCCDMDLCPDCIEQSATAYRMRQLASEDYETNMVRVDHV